MIFVDNLGSWFPKINHSPWDYVTLADFVMPFFLFMVGHCLRISPVLAALRISFALCSRSDQN